MINLIPRIKHNVANEFYKVRFMIYKIFVCAVYRYVKKDAEARITTLWRTAEFFASNSFHKAIYRNLREKFSSDTPARRLFLKGMRNTRLDIAERILVNFLARINLFFPQMHKDLEKQDLPSLYGILISPTMRCNLSCKGCYAGSYRQEEELTLPEIKRIIREGKELGVYLYTVLGGEPFIREDLFEIYRDNPDCVFQVFTNSTLLNEKNVQKLVEVKNVVPVLSIEGMEEETDQRRGKGIFQRIEKGMQNLWKAGVPFGFSVMVTSQNFDSVTSDDFFEMIIKGGAYFGWYFLYMPVGKNPDPALMPTPEQRMKLREIVRKTRKEKPLAVMDFWNDAPFVGGCISGGRRYLHINHKGDVEPCIFIHYATDNVKDKSLKECLKSPFFAAIRKEQPFSENLLCPCQIIDNPQKFRDIFKQTAPKPTDEGAEKLFGELAPHLDAYASRLKELADPVWKTEFKWAHDRKRIEKYLFPKDS
jgi:MoaA/NifB/PqqE/SkfB family radical SAM enzyme